MVNMSTPDATVLAETSHVAPRDGMTLRYFRPAADLFPAITGYHVYGRDERATGDERVDWFLPGTANIRILVDAGRVTVAIGKASFDLPPVSLFGPTTHAMRAITHGGYIVGIGISALGWSRLDFGAASEFCDRIVPLEQLVNTINFHSGAAATSANHRIVFNQATGQLFYDADGNGAGAATLFGLLTPGTVLTASSFEMVVPTIA